MPHAIPQIHTSFYSNRIEMHQSILAVPIPSGISRAFAHVLILGVGHLKFITAPGVGYLPSPGTTLGHLTRHAIVLQVR